MREVSDRLCREARISVIENPEGKKKNYGEWVAEKNGKPTVRDTIRADIDRAILASTTERDFIRVMEEMGYKIETKTETGAPRQHPIVILHGKKHFRLDKAGHKSSGLRLHLIGGVFNDALDFMKLQEAFLIMRLFGISGVVYDLIYSAFDRPDRSDCH